jgi:LysM repeat protein
MPQRRKPNQIARVLAVLALVGAVVLVIATVATNGGSGEDDKDSTKKAEQTGPTRQGQRAVDAGVWVVDEGDTLVSISEETGVDLDQLVELNADIDPQVLITGQRIALRLGQAGEDDESTSESTTTSGNDPADEFGDGSVDGDSSGTSTSP